MRYLGRLAIAAALIVPVGIAAAPSAQAISGTHGQFNCSGTSGTENYRPGLLLNTKLNERFTTSSAVTCTGGSVTGGNLSIDANESKVTCPKLARGLLVAGHARATWNKVDKAGFSNLVVLLTVKSTSGHVTSGTITGTVTSGAIAVTKQVKGTWAIDKGISSIPNGGNCSVKKLLTSANITQISLATQ